MPAVTAVSSSSAPFGPAEVVTSVGSPAEALITPKPVSAPALLTENKPLNVVLALRA